MPRQAIAVKSVTALPAEMGNAIEITTVEEEVIRFALPAWMNAEELGELNESRFKIVPRVGSKRAANGCDLTLDNGAISHIYNVGA